MIQIQTNILVDLIAKSRKFKFEKKFSGLGRLSELCSIKPTKSI